MQEPDGGLAARIFFVGSCCIVCDVIHNAEKSCTGIREKSAIVSQLFASCSVWASTGKIVSNWIWDNTCCPMLQFHNWPAHCLFHLFKVQCTKSWTWAVIFKHSFLSWLCIHAFVLFSLFLLLLSASIGNSGSTQWEIYTCEHHRIWVNCIVEREIFWANMCVWVPRNSRSESNFTPTESCSEQIAATTNQWSQAMGF